MFPSFFIIIAVFFSFILLLVKPSAFNIFALIFFLIILFIFFSSELHTIIDITISLTIKYTQLTSFFSLLPIGAFERFDLLFSISLFQLSSQLPLGHLTLSYMRNISHSIFFLILLPLFFSQPSFITGSSYPEMLFASESLLRQVTSSHFLLNFSSLFRLVLFILNIVHRLLFIFKVFKTFAFLKLIVLRSSFELLQLLTIAIFVFILKLSSRPQLHVQLS